MLIHEGDSVREIISRKGRVIRRYRNSVRIKDFEAWQDRIRGSAKGRGLYALYSRDRLIYVGLATKSIRSRVREHIRAGRIPFTRFSVFLVAGESPAVQGRRIRDLEALLLNVIKPRPRWNKSKTRFVAAKRLRGPGEVQ